MLAGCWDHTSRGSLVQLPLASCTWLATRHLVLRTAPVAAQNGSVNVRILIRRGTARPTACFGGRHCSCSRCAGVLGHTVQASSYGAHARLALGTGRDSICTMPSRSASRQPEGDESSFISAAARARSAPSSTQLVREPLTRCGLGHGALTPSCCSEMGSPGPQGASEFQFSTRLPPSNTRWVARASQAMFR